MSAAGCSEFGDDAPVLIARTRDIEEQASRVKRMVILDRPAMEILHSLGQLRRDLKRLQSAVVRARLQRLADEAGGGEGLRQALDQVLRLIDRAHPVEGNQRRAA